MQREGGSSRSSRGAGPSHHRGRQRALRRRGPPHHDRRQHRHFAGAQRWRAMRQASQKRRRRPLPRQGRRPRNLAVLRGGDGRAAAGAAQRSNSTCATRSRTNEFEVYYQPIYDLAHDRIGGFEALLRWRHPTRGLVSPAEFIAARRRDRPDHPDRRMGAAPRLRARRATGPPHITLAVNVSAAQFKGARADPDGEGRARRRRPCGPPA